MIVDHSKPSGMTTLSVPAGWGAMAVNPKGDFVPPGAAGRAPAGSAGRGGRGLHPGQGAEADDGRDHAAALEDRAPGRPGRDEVTEVAVAGLVRDGLAAGVVALEVAGHRAAAALVDGEQGQGGALGRSC